MLPPHLTQPQHFDGRPLSSASLYNLLSPHPLYFAPPYGLNQFHPAMLNQSWAGNGNSALAILCSFVQLQLIFDFSDVVPIAGGATYERYDG